MTAPAWQDAWLAAQLFALDPALLGGVCLRARPGPVREAWLAALRALAPMPFRRVPLHIPDERLLGGLDLAATLRTGRPVAQRGLLADAEGGVLILAMAERMEAASAARLTMALDTGEVILARDGLLLRSPCRAGLVVLDEGDDGNERPPAALLDRCAFLLDLSLVSQRDATAPAIDLAAARALLPGVAADDDALEALGAAAFALGVGSARSLLLSLRTARAAAALAGRSAVDEADLVIAARLVLAPRATTLPGPAPQPEQPEAEEPEAGSQDSGGAGDEAGKLEETVLDAAQAAIPAGLLAALQAGLPPRQHAAATGRAGAARPGRQRGRPIGVTRGELSTGARLNLVETLRAAAPWQPIRRRASPDAGARVLVRPDDFRITRFLQRTESTVIFVVDASGSAALHRMGEAKGAVELLLADCYVRRDHVALLAFRGVAAKLLLPPTNSLVRARRGLAGMAGGGGTPLASALDQAALLADQIRRRGQTPFIVLLTDGRANIARDGAPGRARAAADAQAAARALRAGGFATLLIDTSASPSPQGRALAAEMAAQYLPLPYAESGALSQAVRQAAPRRG